MDVGGFRRCGVSFRLRAEEARTGPFRFGGADVSKHVVKKRDQMMTLQRLKDTLNVWVKHLQPITFVRHD